ncbi:hypothetical protein GCM10017783_20790 [Deinococcus piscis]|uniref:Uncharacterized protein n=1 Tax=Deinococcus piscis TaxID=394230 RepID=A0ABQ3K8R2_9DEIO|nr:hypothetical protein GCM10017783_20790 [Deinococcus piscis]
MKLIHSLGSRQVQEPPRLLALLTSAELDACARYVRPPLAQWLAPGFQQALTVSQHDAAVTEVQQAPVAKLA